VKPIPASIARPSTSTHASDASRSALVNFAISQVAPNTPIVLPATRPTMIPSVIDWPSASVNPDSPPTATPAEKNAKTGTAKPAEIGRSLCSQCSA